MTSLSTHVLESLGSRQSNLKPGYVAITDFELANYDIVLNRGNTLKNYVEFKKDDEIHVTSQSGSLGDIYTFTNLRTGESAKFMTSGYSMPKEIRAKIESLADLERMKRSVSIDRSEWFHAMTQHNSTQKSPLRFTVLQIMDGKKTGFGAHTTKSASDIIKSFDNLYLKGFKYEYDKGTGQYFFDNVVKPALATYNLEKDVESTLTGDVVWFTLNPKYDMSCFPEKKTGTKLRQALQKFMKEAFMFNMNACKPLKVKNPAKKLPKVKSLSRKDQTAFFEDAIAKLSKKNDKLKFNPKCDQLVAEIVQEALTTVGMENFEVQITQPYSESKGGFGPIRTSCSYTISVFDSRTKTKVMFCDMLGHANEQGFLHSKTYINISQLKQRKGTTVNISPEMVTYASDYMMQQIMKNFEKIFIKK